MTFSSVCVILPTGEKCVKTANVLNIQPVLPFSVGNWNIISRTILPLIYLPSFSTGLQDVPTDSPYSSSNFGLGDINESVYLFPFG